MTKIYPRRQSSNKYCTFDGIAKHTLDDNEKVFLHIFHFGPVRD